MEATHGKSETTMLASRPTRMLSDEHQNILKVIHALERECASLQKGGQIDKDLFDKAVDFIRNYADRFHHLKEEDILFEEMCRDTVALHCNPTQQMRYGTTVAGPSSRAL